MFLAALLCATALSQPVVYTFQDPYYSFRLETYNGFLSPDLASVSAEAYGVFCVIPYGYVCDGYGFARYNNQVVAYTTEHFRFDPGEPAGTSVYLSNVDLENIGTYPPGSNGIDSITVAYAPEPGLAWLVGVGALSAAILFRKHRQFR